jgi:hypothetical protein
MSELIARIKALLRRPGGVIGINYVGEFEHPPPMRLWQNPRVLITPHVSGASDEDRHGGISTF